MWTPIAQPSESLLESQPIIARVSFYVIIRGPLGVGKTSVSKALAKGIGAEYLSIDQILDDHGLWRKGRLAEFLRANRVAVGRAERFLVKGRPVVFDGNFYWKSQIEDLERRLDYPHHVFTLKAPLCVCIARDRRRKPSHGSVAAREVYAKSTKFGYGVGVDATRPPEVVVREIAKRLSPRSDGAA